MAATPPVFLGLGANVGDREANLRAARQGLAARGLRCPDRSQVVPSERSLPR
jgi:7,8-dihydro-6-hydroxymethylpterin-pyrophosphokinase